MRKLAFVPSVFLLAIPVVAAINVPLTVQEAIHSGVAGVSRANEPFCMGVPLADSEGVSNESVLGLSGASAAQFRILGRWPSGNAKWVKVCGIVPSVAAGGTATVTLINGSGSGGGAALATDNGGTISVNTGTASFTIKKARFNVLDTASVNGQVLVASSTASTRGLVITGPDSNAPYPGNVTCLPHAGGSACSTLYSSANDPNSTAVIEENGPVMAVVKATGNHMDANGKPYMQYTARLYFYKDKNYVKTVVKLRNANYDVSATPSPDAGGKTFNTAYKGFESYELRISPSLSGELTYTLEAKGTHTGTLSAPTDSAYIYQGISQWMLPLQDTYVCAPGSTCAATYTIDQGFVARKNSTLLASGTLTEYPQGWADVSNASGAGLQIGMYEFAAQWPASLELNNGGTDVRVGLFSVHNSQPVYQPWPASTTKEVYLMFHTAKPASLVNDFRTLQYPLLARASRTYYNGTAVFPYPIVDPAQEDAFYSSLPNGANPAVNLSKFCFGGGTNNCTPDRSATNATAIANAMMIGMYKAYAWPLGGPLNQEEFRWSDMMRFLQRGQTGRWVNSSQFYRFFAIDKGLAPQADGRSSTDSTPNNFQWRDRPRATAHNRELNGRGFPVIACGGTDNHLATCSTITNSDKAVLSWSFGDYLHNHYSGIFDYYFLTGDESIKDAVVTLKDYYLNNNTYQGVTDPNGSTGWPTRAVGIQLIGASNYTTYLRSIGDPDAEGVLSQAFGAFAKHVKTDTCVSGYPSGCKAPPVNSYPSIPDNEPAGVNRKRGVHTSNTFRGSYFCTDAANPYGIPAYYRAQSSFQASILIEGLLALHRAAGPSWPDSKLTMDLAYGVGQWGLSEAFSDDGTDRWFVGGGTQSSDSLYNGFRYAVQFDHSQVCPAGSTVSPGTTTSIGGKIFNNITLADNAQGHWMHLYIHYLMNGRLTPAEVRKLKLGLYWVGVRQSNWPADFGGYQLGALIYAINNPVPVLQDVPFTLTNLGGGNYRLSWTVPAGTQRYRIKWSPLAIAPSTGLLNFDPISHTFGMNPDQYDTWFGSNNVAEPAPAAAGSTQSIDINGTGSATLTAQSFSVKAYVAGSGNGNTTGPAAILSAVGGNGQSGSPGQTLPAPFVVKVTDGSGNPVPGTPVVFAVTAGGGTLSATSVSTDANGLASSTLRLGSSAGTNTVTAASGSLIGSPITFTATAASASAGASNLTVVSGTGQSGPAGELLANPLVVKVTDSSGDPVAGTPVAFAVTAGGGSLSATSVASDAAGLASTTLRLGSAAGLNTVTATSGTLAGSPITFSATGTDSSSSAQVKWRRETPSGTLPSYVGWNIPQFDPLSGQVLYYLGPPEGAHGIYSTDMWAYNGATSSFTHIGGTGNRAAVCSADLPDMPGDRHPGWQMAFDSRRGVLWLYGGVNQACNGAGVTISGQTVTWVNGTPFHSSWLNQKVVISGKTYTVASVASSTQLTLSASAGTVATPVLLTLASPNTSPREDTYFLRLNANPAQNRWQQVVTGATPPSFMAAMVYDPENDVLFAYGYDGGSGSRNNYLFCRTTENPTPGAATAKQVAAGCTRPDDWNLISPAGGVQPPGAAFPGMVYDTVTKKVILYGGGLANGTTFFNETWAYDVPTRTWTKKALSTTPPPAYNGNYTAQPAMAYNSATNKVLFRQTSNTGAPADWEYDPVADTWTRLTSSGTGPTSDITMTYDAANNRLIALTLDNSSGKVAIWTAELSSEAAPPPPPAGACDLNKDGKVNVVDVQLGINQTLGTAACSSADLNGDGLCNVTDVQRLINATQTGSCEASK